MTPHHKTAHFDVRIGSDEVIGVNVSDYGPDAFVLKDVANEAARRLGHKVVSEAAIHYERVEQAIAVADLAERLYGEGWRP